MTASRIISLLPSATEICGALDLTDRLVGISHECDTPPTITHLPRLTRPKIDIHASSGEIDRQVRALAHSGLSVYAVDNRQLGALHPDLIITQDQCEVCAVSLSEVEEAVAASLGYDCPIVSVRPESLSDVWDSVVQIGEAAGVGGAARFLKADLETRMAAIATEVKASPPKAVAAIEWIDPLMHAAHWTLDLVAIAGGTPVMLPEADPEVIVIMPCGFNLARTLIEAETLTTFPWWASRKAVQSGDVWAVDGNILFNRPGPRLVESAMLLAHCLHPGPVPELPPQLASLACRVLPIEVPR